MLRQFIVDDKGVVAIAFFGVDARRLRESLTESVSKASSPSRSSASGFEDNEYGPRTWRWPSCQLSKDTTCGRSAA